MKTADNDLNKFLPSYLVDDLETNFLEDSPNYEENLKVSETEGNFHISNRSSFSNQTLATTGSRNSTSSSSLDSFSGSYIVTLKPQGQQKKKMVSSLLQEGEATLTSSLTELIHTYHRNLLDVLKTQRGSLIFQQALLRAHSEEIRALYEALRGKFKGLMMDSNANYFCSDLLKICGEATRRRIIFEVKNSIVDIASNTFGTHPIQVLIENLSSNKERGELLSCFDNIQSILHLSMNSYGIHVIKKILEYYEESERLFINSVIINNALSLNTDMNGVCVCKKFISTNQNFLMRNLFLMNVEKNFMLISLNAYGNYIIQHILDEWWGYQEISRMVQLIVDNVIQISLGHCSYHIVEHFLEKMDMNSRKRFVLELVQQENVQLLASKKSGVMVLQKVSQSLNTYERQYVLQLLRFKYGKSVNDPKFVDPKFLNIFAS